MRSGPDLVFRSSAGFVCGDRFVSSKHGRARNVSAVGESVRDRFHFRLAEAFACNLHFAVGINQEKGGNTGQAVGIRNRVTRFVNQNWKRDAKFMCEIARRADIVLRNGGGTDVAAAMLLEHPLEERKGELGDRAGDFEEYQDYGTPL